MNRILSRLLAPLMLLVASGGVMSAQSTHDHHEHAGALCGTATMARLDDPVQIMENLKRDNPEEYRRVKARAHSKKQRPSRIASDDYILWEFYVSGTGPTPNTVRAILFFEGARTRLWIDVRDTARLLAPARAADMLKVIRALDTATHPTRSRNPNQGIVQNNIDLFGEPPQIVALGGGTDFLLTDLPNQNILGYFSGQDQLAKSVYEFSNEMNMLYVDSRQGFSNLEVLLSTIAHEHQHLIHHGRNAAARNGGRADISFYNEGIAELASILNGYYDRTMTSYMANPNIDMFRFSTTPNEQNTDYERATTLLTYLHQIFGEKFIYDFVGLEDQGMLRINSAMVMSDYNLSLNDWRAVMRNYTVANYVKVAPPDIPWYGFDHPNIQNARVNPAGTYNGTDFPLSNEIVLQRNATAYHVYNNPGVINFRYQSNKPTQIMAMFYKDNVFVGAQALEPDTDHLLGRWGGPYSKIVLGSLAMSTESGTVQLSWTATPVTVGVHEPGTAAGGLSIAPLSPNPLRDFATIRFSTSQGSEQVRLELFNAQGILMNTIFEGAGHGQEQSAGLDVSNLPSGMYMLRLRQGDRITTQSVVIAR